MHARTRIGPWIAATLAAFTLASSAAAHGPHDAARAGPTPLDWHDLARTWGLEPLVLASLAITAILYATGVARTWRAAGVGHGITKRDVACFSAGFAALLVAQVSPLHPWSNALFSVHMTQHEILMLVAAPLLVLGRPLVAFLRALPTKTARALASAAHAAWWRRTWRVLDHPLAAWALHAFALWVWHVPALFEAALASELVHALQHVCFLGTALLAWWTCTQGRPRAARHAAAVLFLFTTALHSGLLGALLVFGGSAWYPAYESTARAWGLSALEDQQLGGLIMWVPACTIYVLGGLALFTGWMRASDEGARRWEDGSSGATSSGSPVAIVASSTEVAP